MDSNEITKQKPQKPEECRYHHERFCYLRYENHGYWKCALLGRNPWYGSCEQGHCPDFTPKTKEKDGE